MPQKPPASVGMSLADVDTPALVIDLDAFERNLQRMAEVLISNEVAGAAKLARLAELARRAKVGVCVDDLANVAEIEAAAAAADSRIDVLVEIDVGAGRCGIEPGAP